MIMKSKVNHDTFYSRFSKISDVMSSRFLVFDSELNSMYSLVKELYKTFEQVKKRFDRKETLRVSKTQTEFMQHIVDCYKYPYVLYHFQCRDVNIAVAQFHKIYYVYSAPFRPDLKSASNVQANFYGGYVLLSEAVFHFTHVVMDYIVSCNFDLPF